MKGSYILVINVKKDLKKLKIGKLGNLKFKKGFYCYVGSAIGRSVNLENRLKRHLSKNKKKRWHIDYLLSSPSISIQSIVVIPSKKKLECNISRIIEEKAIETVKKFGSSDCKCKGHLHYFKNERSLVNAINKVVI
jgi:Uri superfamily endonuclease